MTCRDCGCDLTPANKVYQKRLCKPCRAARERRYRRQRSHYQRPPPSRQAIARARPHKAAWARERRARQRELRQAFDGRADGSADYAGPVDLLDTERRCIHGFFTRSPCPNAVVGGDGEVWWCRRHAPG